MNTSTEHILQCNQSEPLADASGRIVDLMNENDLWRVEGRINQYVVVNLHREFRYGVTTADEGLRPISPSKLKYPPYPSNRRY